MAGPVVARTLSDLDAVHQSAAERTLVMRLAKVHIQLASGVDYDNALKALHAGIAQCEQHLAQLEANSPDAQINQRVLKVKSLWQDFRQLAESRPSRASVLALLESSNNLLFQTDALVKEWQARLPQTRSEKSDLAWQQSMLSERIGLFYTAHFYGIDEPWVLEELNHSIKAYEKGMTQLRGAARVAEDGKVLAQLDSQWSYAKLGLQQFNKGSYVPVVVSVAMESMYQQTNQLGDRYLDQDRLAMNEGRVAVGLAANMNGE